VDCRYREPARFAWWCVGVVAWAGFEWEVVLLLVLVLLLLVVVAAVLVDWGWA